MHYCQTCGVAHGEDMEAVPSGETGEHGGEIPPQAAEDISEASVEIARIEGDTAVKIAKIEAGVAESEIESRVSALEGELRGMRETLDRVAPEPEMPQPVPVPEPVVIPEPEPEMPPRDAEHHERAPRKQRGFFS